MFVDGVAGGELLDGVFVGGLDGGLFACGPRGGVGEFFAEGVYVADFRVVGEGFEPVFFGEGEPFLVGGGKEFVHGGEGVGEHAGDPGGGAVAFLESVVGEGGELGVGEHVAGVGVGEGFVVEDELTAEVGLGDGAAEGLVGVGGEFVAVVEFGGIDGEGGFGVEDEEVGVFAGGDGAFLGEAGEVGGEGGEPLGELVEGDVAGVGVGPEDGEGELEGGDSAPGFREVAGIQLLEFGGQGEWSEAIMSMSPDWRACQSASRVAASRMGGAFVLGGAVGNFFCGEVEVVRTGFYGDGDSGGAGGVEGGEGFGGGEVDDVYGGVEFFCEADEEVDGGGFPVGGAGGEVAGGAAGILVREIWWGDGVEFGVGEEGDVAFCEEGEDGAEIGFGGGGEVVDAGVDEEGFDGYCAGVKEGGDFLGVAVDEAGVEADVDLAGGVLVGGLFLLECGEGGGDGGGVEGHVDEGGDTAGGGGFGSGVEAFPVEARGGVGVVDVDVGVDEAGEDGEGAVVGEGVGGGELSVIGEDGFDFSVGDEGGWRGWWRWG